MKKILKKVLERDDYICGLHSEGCGKKIDIIQDDPTLDHIIPKNYIKKRKNKEDFRKSWNYQPMCQKCNQKREGQIIDWPKFNCKCHGVYIDDLGARWIMYKHRTTWHRAKYFEEMKMPEKAPNEERIISDVMIISGGRKNYGGAKAISTGKFGHMFYPTRFYERLKNNAFEFERTEQWGELEKEIEKFSKHYLKSEGRNLKKEAKENYKYSLAKWIYWNFKAQQKKRSKKNKKERMKAIKQKIKEHISIDKKEFFEIEKIAEQLIEGKKSTFREDKAVAPPIGAIIVSKRKSQKMANEAWANWRKGDKEKAGILLNKIIKDYPRDVIGWRHRARFRYTEGDIEGAYRDLTKAIHLKSDASFYAARSDLKMKMGDINGAKEDIEQALLIEKAMPGNKNTFFEDMNGKKITREEEIMQWKKTKNQILSEEKRSDYDYVVLWRKTRYYLAQGKWKETIKGCEDFFTKYKEDGQERFAKKIGKFKDEARAGFYWMAMTARISLEEGFLKGSCQLYKNLLEEGGSIIEQEMEKEIYKIDLNDFELLTNKVKQRTKRAIEQLIKERRITVTKTPLTKEEIAKLPKKRLKLIRPSQGKN